MPNTPAGQPVADYQAIVASWIMELTAAGPVSSATPMPAAITLPVSKPPAAESQIRQA